MEIPRDTPNLTTGNPSENYGASPAVSDHTVLPDTGERAKTKRNLLINKSALKPVKLQPYKLAMKVSAIALHRAQHTTNTGLHGWG